MNKERMENFAGNLQTELDEVKKVTPQNDEFVVYATSTRACNSFLTIYCC